MRHYRLFFIILFIIILPFKLFSLTDGPYVFYHEDNIEVITIIENKLYRNNYEKGEDIIITVPAGENIPSFDIPLRDYHCVLNAHIKELPDSFLVIADFHGRFQGFVQLLRHLDIIDESLNWSFGNGYVIQLGDMLSRGDQQTELLWLTYKLQQEAEKAGGGFRTILGNHEIMHMKGDLRYVHEKYFESVKLMEKEYEDLFSENSLFGRWLRSKNSIMQMGDYLFLHGGYSPELMEADISIDAVNSIIRDYLKDISHENTGFVIGAYGPLWYRGYFVSMNHSHAQYEILKQKEVEEIIEYLNIERIFVGHTRFDELQYRYEGRVIGVDIEHTPDKIEGFLYKDGIGYRVGTDGLKGKIWGQACH